ncbi:transformer-2 protein homolog alpha-like [Hippocampus comes]|uniref:transformer-2 protein homolog alpha-like n=1 Tax=Hippocampus comes TaxID=109280 RepID=UPI00094EA60A|nr:PREDICTED: transformer-2 protein homolog alpha-like [Hippocampus comes]
MVGPHFKFTRTSLKLSTPLQSSCVARGNFSSNCGSCCGKSTLTAHSITVAVISFYQQSHEAKEANSHGGLVDRANPDPSKCLGVFGLSLETTARDLRHVFSQYGRLTGVNVVFHQRSGRSRGYAFVYFERLEDSKEAMERANGMEIDGRVIRVDYSITKRAHTPTPGIYMGKQSM